MVPAGTTVFMPSSRYPSPCGVAAVAGARRSRLPGSEIAAVSTTLPSAAGVAQRACCSAVPNAAIGPAPSTAVAATGTGATVRPTCSSTTHCSTSP